MATLPTRPWPNFVTIGSLTPTRVSEAHNLRRVTRANGPQRWVLKFGWRDLKREDWAVLYAFFVAQRGAYGSFTAVISGLENPRGVATGTPISTVTSQTGRSIATAGWTPNITGILKAGDYIKFANHAKVYMVVADCNSDGSGAATLTIEPALQVAIASQLLTVRNVPFTLALKDPAFETAITPGMLGSLEVDFVETY